MKLAWGLFKLQTSAMTRYIRDIEGDLENKEDNITPSRMCPRTSRLLCDPSTMLQSAEQVRGPSVSSVSESGVAEFSFCACYGGCGDCDNLDTFLFDR